MTEKRKHSCCVGITVFWSLILFLTPGDAGMSSVNLRKQLEFIETHKDIWLNCSSDSPPFGDTAEYLMNFSTLENVVRSPNGECYRTIQRAKCSNNTCFCAGNGKSFGLLYNTGSRSMNVVLGCKMVFLSEDGSELYTVIDSMSINVVRENDDTEDKQMISMITSTSFSIQGNDSNDQLINGTKVLGKTLKLHHITLLVVVMCFVVVTGAVIQLVNTQIIRRKQQTRGTRQRQRNHISTRNLQQYQDLTHHNNEDHSYGSTPRTMYEGLSDVPSIVHIYDQPVLEDPHEYVDCNDM